MLCSGKNISCNNKVGRYECVCKNDLRLNWEEKCVREFTLFYCLIITCRINEEHSPNVIIGKDALESIDFATI